MIMKQSMIDSFLRGMELWGWYNIIIIIIFLIKFFVSPLPPTPCLFFLGHIVRYVLAKKKSLGCFQGTDQRATTTKGLQESPQTFFSGPYKYKIRSEILVKTVFVLPQTFLWSHHHPHHPHRYRQQANLVTKPNQTKTYSKLDHFFGR